jgi:transposase
MQYRHAISDPDWERIKHLLPGQLGPHGKAAKDNRLFLNAVLGIAKTGAPGRDLPERFGNGNRVGRRFDRWASKGVWRRVFETLPDPDLEWLILDSTSLPAHPHAAGAQKKRTAAGAKPIRLWGGAAADSRPRSPVRSAVWDFRRSSS